MTGEQILRGMTMIDEVFILEAAPRTEQKQQRRRTRGWLGYAAAACLGLLVCGSLLWQMVKPIPAKAFEIEDGVLLAYHGTDAEVVIPDEVTKISSSAFAAAPSPDSITSLYIGANVAEIESDALAPLTELDTVTVAEENEFFEVVDGVLARKDGSLLFASIGAGQEHWTDAVLVDVMRRVKNGELPFATVSKILVGNATIKVEMKEDPYGPLYYVSAVTAYGKTTVLPDEAFPINEYQKLQMFELKECFVISFLDNEGVGQTYIMTEEETFIINNPSSDIIHEGMKEPSPSVIQIYTDGENLLYERVAKKFYLVQPSLELTRCVSREEFYQETGNISWSENKLIYDPAEVKRICDVRDLDSYWAKYAESVYHVDPNKVSLDEYFEKNAEKYGRAN